MSATAEVRRGVVQKVRPPGSGSLRTRIRARLHRHRLDSELASGADPNIDPIRRERAQDLLGEETRHRVAASLESLLAEADSPAHGLTAKAPIARAAIRESRWDLETIIERLKAPAYISSQGVAMILLLLADGASPLYGNNRARSGELCRALAATVEAIDHGPVLVG
jgi:hypothetical protein